MEQDWFSQATSPQPQSAPPASRPVAPAYIPGPPKQADPADQQRLQYQGNADSRANEDQAMQRRKFELEQQKLQLDRQKFGAEQGKAASFYRRALDANSAYERIGADPESYIGRTASGIAPGLTSMVSSDQRNSVRANERAFIGAILRYDSGAAIPPQEFTNAYETYFPSPNAGKDEIETKSRLRETALAGLRDASGPGAANIPAPTVQDNRETDIRFGDQQAAPQELANLSSEDDALLRSQIRTMTPDQLTAFFKERGFNADPKSIADAYAYYQGGGTGYGGTRNVALDQQLEQAKRDRATASGAIDAYGRGGADAVTLGFADELAALGDTVARGGTYADNLARQRTIDQADSAVNPGSRFGGQLTGGALLPFGAGASTPTELARVGAVSGGIYGVGSGTDAQSRVTGGALGALTGGVTGYGIGRAAQAAAPIAQNVLGRVMGAESRNSRNALMSQANDVVAAGQAEGVPVSRMIADPSIQNKVTGVEATIAGGRPVRNALADTGQGIEARVGSLGGGTAGNEFSTGVRTQEASTRFIAQTGAEANRLYGIAEKRAGDVKVVPETALGEIGGLITRLNETPSVNAAEIAFLKQIESDIAGGVSVGGLRDLRTKLRQQLHKGDLTFGQNEARLQSVIDNISTDISTKLAEVAPGANKAFQRADQFYRQRMDMIGNTIQRVIGKRDANYSAEKIASNLRAMAESKDSEGFMRMLRVMTPEERADTATTFAAGLGRNNKGDFTPTQFLIQVEKIPQAVRTSLFGREGEQSIQNLKLLSQEYERVSRNLNNSRTGAANNYRGWLLDKVFGGASGGAIGLVASGGNPTAGITSAVVGGGAAFARDFLTARAVTSTELTKWLRSAPRTLNPAQINAHYDQLKRIAVRNPVLSGEVQAISQKLIEAARSLPGQAVAEPSRPTPENNR